MGTGNVGTLKLLISFPGMFFFPSPFFVFFEVIFFLRCMATFSFFFHCGREFAFVGSVHREEKGARQKVVLEMIGNEREAALG